MESKIVLEIVSISIEKNNEADLYCIFSTCIYVFVCVCDFLIDIFQNELTVATISNS